MDENRHINIDIHQGIMRIGINRPDKKNALTDDMYDTMRLALEKARENQAIKIVLFHGTDNAFCAGNDLKSFDHRAPGAASPGARFLTVLQAFEKPVVAAVSGIAVGVGGTLLLHCDLVYAASDTRFRMPFVNLGVCPEAGSTFLLPASAGYKKAAEVLMLGEFFDASKAVTLGIINDTVPAQDLLAHAVNVAEQLAQKPRQALLVTKHLLKQGGQQEVAHHMRAEFESFSALLLTPESIEARGKLQTRIQKSDKKYQPM